MSLNRVLTKETERLFKASEDGDAKVVAELVKDPKVDINWHRSMSYGATPLIIAITNGHKEVVKILLDAGSDYSELKTPDRNSPLHEAAFCDEPEILNLVLEKIHSTHSPDGNQQNSYLIDLTNQFGNTPLHNAACAGSEECVRLLLKNDAKYNIKNISGSIPLHHACYCEKPNLPVVKQLVDAGSNVNERDTHGYTPLIIAAKKNQTEAIKYLLLHGADPKVTNEDEEDALHFAHLRENLEAIKLLE